MLFFCNFHFNIIFISTRMSWKVSPSEFRTKNFLGSSNLCHATRFVHLGFLNMFVVVSHNEELYALYSHQILFGWWNQEEWDGWGTWHLWDAGEVGWSVGLVKWRMHTRHLLKMLCYFLSLSFPHPQIFFSVTPSHIHTVFAVQSVWSTVFCFHAKQGFSFTLMTITDESKLRQ